MRAHQDIFILLMLMLHRVAGVGPSQAPPVLGQVSPSFLIHKEGDDVDLFCEAIATPEPTLTWYKDGSRLKPSKRANIQGNRIQLQDLDRSDGGVYTCTFKNLVGQVSHVIKLVIEGNAYIMVPPKNTTVNEGQRVKLTCQAEGYPNNITYRWFKDGVDIQLVKGLMTRAGVYADGSFVISTVLKQDMGWYKCRPSNGLGPAPEASAYLNVTYLPVVVHMPLQVYLPRGMSGRIPCDVDANPPVTLLVWTKNERVINFESNKRLKLNKQGTLILRTVISSDEGRYTCTPYSPLGAGQSSPVLQVIVRDPPYFTVRPKQYYQQQPERSVTMPCMADGDPKPIITWRKADGTFPSKTKTLTDGGNLTIVNLVKEDHGMYECVATNVVTSVITSTKLIIEMTTPHAPYNVTVETTQYAAKLSWMPAYDGGYPQHYVIWYKLSSASRDRWETIRVVPNTATSFTVYNMYADTEYQFSILSRNRLGDGLFSKILTTRTKGYDPNLATVLPTDRSGISYWPPIINPLGPRPPPATDLSVRRQKNGLLLSWNPPRNMSIPVLYYSLKYRTTEEWLSLATHIRDTWYVWRQPKLGPTYYFQVVAHSKTAHSIPSNIISIFTGDTSKPEGLTATMVGAIVGSLIGLGLLIFFIIILVKFCNKRRQRERALRYGNVKYFGPKQVDSNKNAPGDGDRDDGDGDSRGGFVTGAARWCTRIFTLQNWDNDYRERIIPPWKPPPADDIQEGGILNGSFSPYDERYKSPWRVGRSARTPRYEVDYARPIGRISRAPDGRFVLPAEGHEDQEVCALDHDVNDIITSPDVHIPYRSRPRPSDLGHVPRVPPGGRQLRQLSVVPQGGISRPLYQSQPRRPDGGYWPPGGRQWYKPEWEQDSLPRSYSPDSYNPSCVDSERVSSQDGVIMKPHPLMRPPPPSHSPKKPDFHRTYLTSSPDEELSQPFIISDISSVIPSSANGSRPSYFGDSNITPNLSSIPSGSGSYKPRPRPRPGPEAPPRSYVRDNFYDTPRHWQPRQESSPRERYPTRKGPWEQQGTPVPPSAQKQNNSNDSGGSSGKEMTYTRDQLEQAVDRVRRGYPRSYRRMASPGQSGPGESSVRPQRRRHELIPQLGKDGFYSTQSTPDSFARNVAPYKDYPPRRASMTSSSGRGSSAVASRPRHMLQHGAGQPSPDSSGIGSRDTSHSTSSHRGHSSSGTADIPLLPMANASLSSSNATPMEHDISTDSAPFLDTSGHHRRDVSGDENYEFDSVNALESELLDALRHYTQHPDADRKILNRLEPDAGQEMYATPQRFYPIPHRQSKYENSEERCARLRQEYLAYRRNQSQENDALDGTRVEEMESDML